LRDAFIIYRNGRRIAVSDLPLSEVLRLEACAPFLRNTGGSDRTPSQLRDRLQIELIIRNRRLNSLI
jgi:hypothetical protein